MHKKEDVNQVDFFSQLQPSIPEGRKINDLSSKSIPQKTIQAKLEIVMPQQKFNKDIAWGIRRTHLEKLKFRHLQNIFSGMHNVTIPGSICQSLNPSEILNIYLAAGDDKYDAYIKYHSYISNRQEPDDFASIESRRKLYVSCLEELDYDLNLGILDLVKMANH